MYGIVDAFKPYPSRTAPECLVFEVNARMGMEIPDRRLYVASTGSKPKMVPSLFNSL
ncbi:MAG: hypothetical protein OSJ28_10700 [Desulfovibrio sp.]|nr:hypothetical protein [Desulfovibrio sp.]